jgi:hypothetical protein
MPAQPSSDVLADTAPPGGAAATGRWSSRPAGGGELVRVVRPKWADPLPAVAEQRTGIAAVAPPAARAVSITAPRIPAVTPIESTKAERLPPVSREAADEPPPHDPRLPQAPIPIYPVAGSGER